MCGCGCSGTNPACGVVQKQVSQDPIFSDLLGSQFNTNFESWMDGAPAPSKPAGLVRAYHPTPGRWTVYKPAGDTPAPIAAPAGLTQAQWSALTPDQRTQYVNADIKTQQDIRDALVGGFKTTADLILAGLKQGDTQAQRDHELELARIQASTEIERARIQADRDVKLGPPLQTTTPLQLQTVPTSSSDSSTGIAVAVGIGAGLWWLSKQKKGKKK